ncbi:MAG: gfo/Idh/MocA family oxidoreductase [bacterium]|nr:gfo/Idh/MocA family oxidoreductase [bacterium]
MNTIRWGIMGTANIALEAVIPATQRAAGCAVTAVASRSLEKAQAAARRYSIAKAYGSYQDLLDDGGIDAVYIPLPNHLHVPWSIKAIEAGKHVLCEKPIAPTAAEGLELVNAARAHPELKVMEAFMYRHHPQWRAARELAGNGTIGEVKAIQSVFTFYDDAPGTIVNSAECGGGALRDIGCYCISLSRFLFGAEPSRVCALVEYDPRFQVDRLSSGLMEFERGASSFVCSTQLADYQRVQVYGTAGRLEIEIPFNPPIDRSCRLWLQRGETVEEILFDRCDHYTIQAELFAEAIQGDGPVPTPIEDAVANMMIIEAIWTSGRESRWVSI